MTQPREDRAGRLDVRLQRLAEGYAGWRGRVARLGVRTALPLAFLIAMLPDQPGPEFGQSDKLVHSLVFLVLTLLARLGWPQRMIWSGWPALLLGYGAAIELAQSLLPWREASVLDWLADAVGIGAAMLLIARERALGSRAVRQ